MATEPLTRAEVEELVDWAKASSDPGRYGKALVYVYEALLAAWEREERLRGMVLAVGPHADAILGTGMHSSPTIIVATLRDYRDGLEPLVTLWRAALAEGEGENHVAP